MTVIIIAIIVRRERRTGGVNGPAIESLGKRAETIERECRGCVLYAVEYIYIRHDIWIRLSAVPFKGRQHLVNCWYNCSVSLVSMYYREERKTSFLFITINGWDRHSINADLAHHSHTPSPFPSPLYFCYNLHGPLQQLSSFDEFSFEQNFYF